jgi:uncharacterized heparinase superfamily protein
MGGHTHNDKLSFELFYKGKDFIVDPGTAIYTGNSSLRNRMRSVNSHSTAVINDSEQNRFKKSLFDLMYDCKTTLDLKELSNAILIEGSNEITHGEDKSFHKRIVNIKRDEVMLHDEILGELKNVKFVLMLHPNVRVEEKENEMTLINGDESISIITENKIEINSAIFSKEYGHWVESNMIELIPEIDNGKRVNSKTVIRLN